MTATDPERSALWTWRLAALFAAGVVGLWIPWSLGLFVLGSPFGVFEWMAHELLYGVLPLIAAGIVWRDRSPKIPETLVAAAAWAAGRLVMGADVTGPGTTAAIALLFPLLVFVNALRHPQRRAWFAGGLILVAAQGLFHWEVWRFGLSEWGLAAALVVVVLAFLAATGSRHGMALAVAAVGLAGYGVITTSPGVLRAAEVMVLLAVPAAAAVMMRPRFKRLNGAALSAAVAAVVLAAWNSGWAIPLLPLAWLAWVGSFTAVAVSAKGIASQRNA